ncbi:MAG: hypothetical protein ACREP1_12205, partial [Rhodanobacteraceae bacterium]
MIARFVLTVLLVVCAGGAALAGTARPNALDRSVDSITVTQLLARPAAQLVDGDRQAAALRLQRYRAPVWLLMVFLQIAVLAWFWRSGRAAAWRNRLRRFSQSEFLVRFCFGASLVAIAKLAALLPQFVEYRLWRIMDISTQLFRAWLGMWALDTILAMAIAGLIAAVVL